MIVAYPLLAFVYWILAVVAKWKCSLITSAKRTILVNSFPNSFITGCKSEVAIQSRFSVVIRWVRSYEYHYMSWIWVDKVLLKCKASRRRSMRFLYTHVWMARWMEGVLLNKVFRLFLLVTQRKGTRDQDFQRYFRTFWWRRCCLSLESSHTVLILASWYPTRDLIWIDTHQRTKTTQTLYQLSYHLATQVCNKIPVDYR